MTVACEHYERAVRLQPDNARFLFQLAVCEWRLGRPEAGAHFCKAVELGPQFALAHAVLGVWSSQNGRIDVAERASSRAMELAPDDNKVIFSRASVLESLGEMDAAWRLVERLVQRQFLATPLIGMYGRMANYRSRQPEALKLIEDRLVGSQLSPANRSRLHFTAAELLDSLGQYDEAFDHARRGNELVRPVYDRAAHEGAFQFFIDYFTRTRIAELPKGSDPSDKPVFIVGMPRSGTSLVEQILASHPAVHGGGELEFMPRVTASAAAMLSAARQQHPPGADRLTAEQTDALGQMYLRQVVALNPAAARITDKLPLNFLHLGLVALVLPGARVIDCGRDPRDTCLSCFMTMFEAGNDFAYDLGDTAHFYGQYQRLMQHWKSVLDLPILDVMYEDVVSDVEGQTRRMLDFLGLQWDDRCLRFHDNKRPVTTASIQQVRRPLYQSSIGRWRHYANHLGELNWWFGLPEPGSPTVHGP